MEELMEETYARKCHSKEPDGKTCSNSYALRKAAIDNRNFYGNYAAAAIMKNFYMDYLLKSVEDEEYTKCLIRRIQNMCTAGGNLTKFVCNNKSVMMRIPENHMRKNLKTLT